MNVMHQTSSASSCISFRLTTCQRLLMTRCFVSLASSLYGKCSSFWASIFLRPHSVLAWAECQAVIFARYLVSAKSRLMIEATHFASAESEICTLLWSLVHGNMHSPTNSYYRGLLWVLQFFLIMVILLCLYQGLFCLCLVFILCTFLGCCELVVSSRTLPCVCHTVSSTLVLLFLNNELCGRSASFVTLYSSTVHTFLCWLRQIWLRPHFSDL